MTTLEDLYYGDIVPHEHSFKRGSAYSEVLSYVIRHQDRSEERRVGKECRSRWSPYH